MTATLSTEQIAFFRERGYLRLDAITTADEVERLRGVFDRLFAERAGWEKGKSFDLAGTDEADKKPVLPQILNPVEFAPELAETQFRVNALAIARELLGPTAELWFEHAIFKPAHYGAPTTWPTLTERSASRSSPADRTLPTGSRRPFTTTTSTC